HKRVDLDDWVFGCDICQDVCPWNNRFAKVEHDVDFAPSGPLPHLSPHNLLSMDQAEFSKKFSGSPVKRTKRSGLLRNASVVLGNRVDNKSIHSLATSLTGDPDPIIRAHSAWALGQIGDANVVNLLSDAQENEIDADVLIEIQSALDEFPNRKE
ncbi:MAG: HEAT repeat domain-containing protein, partial [Chloroflexota bacterium]|nr:HEAT repeat domain-containing protein [Chloroflexota bacterium]